MQASADTGGDVQIDGTCHTLPAPANIRCAPGLSCVGYSQFSNGKCAKDPTYTPPPGSVQAGGTCHDAPAPESLTCAPGFICQGYGQFSNGTCVQDANASASAVTGLTGTLPPPPSPPCKQWVNGQCTTFSTAVGDLATDPGGFVKTIFAVLLSFSGGVALLLIIRAGYRLMTSQGKPESITQGRDQLVAAIVGLVFIIFSFVILETIGFDILHLPGFAH